MNVGMQNLDLLTAIAILALAAVAAWRRFGAEYRPAASGLGDRAKSESESIARNKRAGDLEIVPLSAAEGVGFSRAWQMLQSRFVDNPQGVLVEADHLVRELMTTRGYPMADFKDRAADISVDHPAVVEHYRAAQAMALRDRRGDAYTEELRTGLLHYRALFRQLLEPSDTRDAPAKQTEAIAQARRSGSGDFAIGQT